MVAGLVGGGGTGAAGVVRVVDLPARAGQPVSAPVLAIDAPVLDVVTATSDLAGTVKDEESATQVKLTLDAMVLFAKDSAKLTPRAREVLARVAQRVNGLDGGAVRIVGYTDDLGTAAHGLVLSRQRAQAVASALRPAFAAGGYRFTVEGKGEADPVVPNRDEAGRRQNRRVEITVTRAG
jgi:outer membrane protein OmpA-like peptidoglycan-associated protein